MSTYNKNENKSIITDDRVIISRIVDGTPDAIEPPPGEVTSFEDVLHFLLNFQSLRNKKEWQEFLSSYIQQLHIQYGYVPKEHGYWIDFSVTYLFGDKALALSSWNLSHPYVGEYSKSLLYSEFYKKTFYKCICQREINNMDDFQEFTANRIVSQLSDYKDLLALWMHSAQPRSQTECSACVPPYDVQYLICNQQRFAKTMKHSLEVYKTVQKSSGSVPGSIIHFFEHMAKRESLIYAHCVNVRSF